ncbi:MAG: hypothetical protein L6R30_19195 [Thermoanaerobaculia bacterium]|nr:hypothetical protein [Thermoanaerobaculia bacterium]
MSWTKGRARPTARAVDGVSGNAGQGAIGPGESAARKRCGPGEEGAGRARPPVSILRFWLPLAATWLMMAAEGPFVAALVARLPEPKYNLGAFGVALALAFVAESPILMMLATTTALARDRESLARVRRFSFLMNGAVTAAMGLIAFPPVFDLLASRVLALPPPVAERAQLAVALFLPWPAAIGFRRFQQGILIGAGRTRLVAYGTAVRLATMAGTGLLLFLVGGIPGAVVGASALSAGVVVEAVASWIWARADRERLMLRPPASPGEVPTLAEIQRFYWPLAVTPLMNMAVQPMVTFFVGRGHLPIESLAVVPVVNSFAFLFRTPALAFQEVIIALGRGGEEALRSLRRFATTLGGLSSLAMAAVVLTPAAGLWFEGVTGLGADLVPLARRSAAVLVLLPAAAAAVVWAHARLVMLRTTRLVTWGTVIELTVIATSLGAGIRFSSLPAAIVASASILAGRCTGAVFLLAARILKPAP